MKSYSLPVRTRSSTLQVSVFLSYITDTWFRVLVKMVARDAHLSYSWHEMTFCSRWVSGHCTILCIGASSLFRGLLQDALAQLGTMLQPWELYSLHVPLLEAVVAMQDLSVWSVRDIVRSVEKASTLTKQKMHRGNNECSGPLTSSPRIPRLLNDARGGTARYSLFRNAKRDSGHRRSYAEARNTSCGQEQAEE